MNILARRQPQLLSVLRMITALVFMQHGTQKLFHFPVNPDAVPNAGPTFLSLIWIAGFIEVVGGALMLVGLWTRIIAFVASGEMAIAYFQGHASRNFFPLLNGGDLAIVFCFVFLYLSAAGPGPWSVDAQIGRGKSPSRLGATA